MNQNSNQIGDGLPSSYNGEQQLREKVFSDAQLFLTNREFRPYPNGRGGINTSICSNHARYQRRLIEENALWHSLYFRVHIRNYERETVEN